MFQKRNWTLNLNFTLRNLYMRWIALLLLLACPGCVISSKVVVRQQIGGSPDIQVEIVTNNWSLWVNPEKMGKLRTWNYLISGWSKVAIKYIVTIDGGLTCVVSLKFLRKLYGILEVLRGSHKAFWTPHYAWSHPCSSYLLSSQCLGRTVCRYHKRTGIGRNPICN